MAFGNSILMKSCPDAEVSGLLASTLMRFHCTEVLPSPAHVPDCSVHFKLI